ncbi:MAG: DUF72 domain-containing protein [Calditrichaeota bacterium]|nr:MAG: DUF72 domain-containing protein [Calditrichota bacterium]
MAELYIGTCSWKYDSWRGLVYSDKKPLNYLEEYARHYRTVEIDQWFWSLFGINKVSLPRPEVVQEYLRSVPPSFRFTIKMPNSITLTHFYRKRKDEPLRRNPYFLSHELLREFLRLISPMKPHIGMLMFQFEYLNKQKMRDQYDFQKQFSQFIEQADRSYPYGVEIRNPQYLNRAYFEFLRRNQLSHVFLEGYYMPPIVQVYEKYREMIEGTTVIRLHGGDRREMEQKSGEQWNKIWEDRSQELRSVAEMIRDLLSRGVTVYLNVNNHYEGSAPLTIRRIQELLDF